MKRPPYEIEHLLRSSVVEVQTQNLSNPEVPFVTSGTGYLLSPIHVATCYHVLIADPTACTSMLQSIPPANMKVRVRSGSQNIEGIFIEEVDSGKIIDKFLISKQYFNKEQAKKIYECARTIPTIRLHANPRMDCAIIRLSRPLIGHSSMKLGIGCDSTEHVWIRGFPSTGKGDNQELVLSAKIINPFAEDVYYRPAIVVSADSIGAGPGAEVKGLSGAPAITEDGLCIGHVKNAHYFTLRETPKHGQLYLTPSIYTSQLLPNVIPTRLRKSAPKEIVRRAEKLRGKASLRLLVIGNEFAEKSIEEFRAVIRHYHRPQLPNIDLLNNPFDPIQNSLTDVDICLILLDNKDIKKDPIESVLLQRWYRLVAGSWSNTIAGFILMYNPDKNAEKAMIRNHLLSTALDLTDEQSPYPVETTDRETVMHQRRRYWIRVLNRLFFVLNAYMSAAG